MKFALTPPVGAGGQPLSPVALGVFGAGVAGALVGAAALGASMLQGGKLSDKMPAILAASLVAAVVGGVMLSRTATPSA